MRKVRFPLKLKLLTLMIVLIASSLIVFVGIALKIFREDKSAYIYETLLNKANSEQVILSMEQGLSAGSFRIENSELKFGDSTPPSVVDDTLAEDSLFEMKIIVPQQGQFYSYQNKVLKLASPEEQDLLSAITEQSVYQAVREISLDGVKFLYAFDYNPVLNYAYVVTLTHEKAFSVTSYLINKSIYYGLFILGIAMVLSVLLARPLTSQLEVLFGMTQELAGGHFDKRVSLKGSDEVGALSDSINDMADKIVVYMGQMKEKARLENEVHVAQLVQASFFPSSTQTDSSLSIHGHFEPATECGGDWWGVFDHEDWKIFFIADATGHGVPAALLTATINCCKTSLKFIIETRPQIVSEPHEILRYMNQAVFGAGKEIQVTCFVASFNKKSREFIFSNSSQTPPLLFNGEMSELTKDSFQPLIEANGPRLGQKSETNYESHKIILKTHDTIFAYTDGLTEAENLEGNRWGERRLIKSLTQHGTGPSVEIIEGVMKDFQDFTSQKPKNDDLTAVAMKVT